MDGVGVSWSGHQQLSMSAHAPIPRVLRNSLVYIKARVHLFFLTERLQLQHSKQNDSA